MSYLSTGIVAADTKQSGATVLSSKSNYFQIATCTSVANGVMLPAGVPYSTSLKIRNDGIYTLFIHHPRVGGFINTLPATVAASAVGAYQLAPGCIVEFVIAGDSQAYTFGNNSPGMVSITGAYTVLPCQNGIIFSVANALAAYAITLPAPTIPGLKYKFVSAGQPNDEINITSTGANISGNISLQVNGAPDALVAVPSTIIRFTINAVAGDYADIVSDGVHWACTGMTVIADGMEFA